MAAEPRGFRRSGRPRGSPPAYLDSLFRHLGTAAVVPRIALTGAISTAHVAETPGSSRWGTDGPIDCSAWSGVAVVTDDVTRCDLVSCMAATRSSTLARPPVSTNVPAYQPSECADITTPRTAAIASVAV